MVEQAVLERDMATLAAMLEHLDDYLMSDATRWEMGKPDMPPMTIGGILMRLRRLPDRQSMLYEFEREGLRHAREQFERTIEDHVVRFEQRAHQELGARLREWTTYLRDLSSRRAAERSHYAYRADTRLVIGELIARLSQPPFKLQVQILGDLDALDSRLRSRWVDGAFVLDSVWESVYPPDEYWWLYGNPKAD